MGAIRAVPTARGGFAASPAPEQDVANLPRVSAETGVRAVGGRAGLNASPAARAGVDGRGIRSVHQDAAGHLIVTYDDGSTQDAGLMRGRDGQDGLPGRSSFINGTITVSTDPPSGGQDGDIWLQY